MNWQSLMAELESWLWQTPYLDMPNYAWITSGLAIMVLALYLIVTYTTPPPTEKDQEPDLKSDATPEPQPDRGGIPPAREQAPSQERTSSVQDEMEAIPLAPEEPEPEAPPEPMIEEPPAPEEAVEEEVYEEVELVPPEGWLKRLKQGLAKTQGRLGHGIDRLLSGSEINDELMEELEELLITSDLGVQTATNLLEHMQEAVKKEKMKQGGEVRDWLKQRIEDILSAVEKPLDLPEEKDGPYVIMVTGVNGTGKTTTIGKLAMRFKQDGNSVLIGAADTFRAAAIEQLRIWADRAGCQVVAHQEGADPSAVAFDTIKAALARDADVVIIDTAGRLHTKVNLMEELKKVKRITGRELEGAPHEVLLVLDATTGQNAVQQAKMFDDALQVTGLVLTKLDGTAKGGIIVAISDQFKIPIRFIGVGEKIYDLQPFNASEFVQAIFED